ncbi:putative ubiquitin-protein ligase [Tripterygium wilfordii]|uniref:RING-type E3 ubiquitin transferase n=1 Tax=Tripterygium wilfordii TaxID=458696 RepID=A0A7J7CX90_TRIWF|nr:E3 ubiquitin-protein ligase SINA-like 10 isoform X1 [Tripterygium wilfordii]XP_038721014.1 E3 ubiquitin-protein ligase SINA-like 10 isoform X1 [Tripterygium wilfordii]XP_038721015.1 E3 ubiquitin-protein ligase SINA-like 10 isoform X1 [Tripterygium wilfordii]KAF5738506.1 putative ubiquitin-protein ligase [Tripterygium wilfordii]
MAKFSVGAEEDGEGPSNSCRLKRRRSVSPPSPENQSQEEDQTGATSFMLPPESSNCADGVGSGHIKTSKDVSVIVSLTEPEVLDCAICYEPLTIPVFQCENGHTACSQCCTQLRNKCPSCSLPIGYNRCRAIEKVLESVRLSCQYNPNGCKETMSYSKKRHHEKICIYSPYPCPFPNCSYCGSYKQFSVHFKRKHTGSVKHFQYNCTFRIQLHQTSDVRLVLQEDKGDLFVIRNDFEILGNAVTLRCFAPCSTMERHAYDLEVKTAEGTTLKIHSLAENIQSWEGMPVASGTFLLIPTDFFRADEYATLSVHIYHKGVGSGL